MFEDLEDDMSDYDDVEQMELDRYLSFRLPEPEQNFKGKIRNNLFVQTQHYCNFFVCTEKFDVLCVCCNRTDFPMLKKIAQRVLAIPASEVTEERVFSGALDML